MSDNSAFLTAISLLQQSTRPVGFPRLTPDRQAPFHAVKPTTRTCVTCGAKAPRGDAPCAYCHAPP